VRDWLRLREVPSRYEAVWLAGAFVLAFLVVFSRRPDALLNAQFFLEDGLWYEQAHEMGPLNALVYPYLRGYLQVVPRLAAWLALGLPFEWAPFVMTSVGIAVSTLPAVFLCSNRLVDAIPSLALRIGLGLLYLALPNSWSPIDSTIANITHGQWHLAPLACMILVARPAATPSWRVFDVAILVLTGLSGPMGIFLVPVGALVWWRRRTPWSAALVATIGATAAIQIVTLLLFPDPGMGRPPLGPSVARLARLVSGRVVYGAIVGQTGYSAMVDDPSSFWLRTDVVIVVALLAALAAGFAAWKGPFELRLFLLYTALAFAAFLVWPIPSPITVPHWELMAHPSHHRYFVAPMFALFLVLVWMASRRPRALQAAAVGLLGFAVLFGVVRDWQEPPHPDFRFADYAAKFARAAPGQRVQIPFPPNWSIILTKR
jgi:hypothetical protein